MKTNILLKFINVKLMIQYQNEILCFIKFSYKSLKQFVMNIEILTDF